MADDDDNGREDDEPPAGEDLPPTGAHHVLPGDEEEPEGETGIPSFEEYRRAREEERGRGAWSPFGAEPTPGPEEAQGEPAPPPDEEPAEQTLPVHGRELDEEEAGDTLDGGEALEGVELPDDEEEGWQPRRYDENGDPITFEEQLAAEAVDVLPSGFEHSEEEIRARRAEAHRRHRRNGRIRLLILLAVVALVALFVVDQLGGSPTKPKHKPPSKPTATLPTSPGRGPKYLAKGSDPSVLPGNVLIADWGARRLLVVSPEGQIVWTYSSNALFSSKFNPDYAFFNAAGDAITINEESHAVIEQLNVAKKKVTYHYGHYDRPGSPANYLDDPGTAIALSDGTILAADIRNCRVSVLHPPSHFHVRNLGHVGKCVHDPPHHYDNPVSAFPLSDGGLVITELSGDVVLLDASGKLTATFPVPGFTRPVAVNETAQGDLVAVDHTHPGAVEILSLSGKIIWRYAPKRGKAELFDPSMALVLPNGDVLVSDDHDNRVIVIDRATRRIVWQYGHLHRARSTSGYLYLPVGVDLVHPDSLLDRFPNATAPR
jgi:hypothetical protein